MSGMASFLAGLGGGMLKGHMMNKREAREKQDDDWRDEQRSRQRKEWSDADKLDTDLRDAAAPRTTMQGTVTEGGGQKLLNTDPAQAAAMQDTLAAEAELKGDAAPTQRQGSAVTGNLSKGSEITDTPVDLAKVNSPDARNERIAGALRTNGKIERAVSMENSMLDQAAKRLGLDSAQAQFADEQFNRKLNDTFASNPDWTGAAAKVLTETQVGTLSGVTVVPKLSADGKTVEFVGTKEGAEGRTLASFPNTDEGKAKFLAQAMRAPLATKVGFLVEGFRADRAQKNADREFDLRKQGQENDQQYRQRMLSFQAAQEGRARQVHAIAMEDAKIPPAVKLQAQTLAKQMEGVGTALNKAMAEGLFDPNNPNSAKLIETQTALQLKYAQLLKPYTPGGKTANADPLGLGGPQPAAGGAPAASTTPGASVPPQRPGAAPMQGATQQPVDVLRGRVIGTLTPMADIVQSAQAGNQEAIAFLASREQGQAATATAPRTAAQMLNQ